MSKIATILICTLLALAAVGEQNYRDNRLLIASHAATASAKAAQAAAEDAQAAAQDHDAKVSAAAIEVLRQFKKLKTAADFCRM